MKQLSNDTKQAFKAAFPKTLPILAGFSFLGIAYGILMSSKGYGILWCFLMSAIAFCGSMQFVAITLLTTAFHPLQAFLLSLMVNARHLFYGLSMIKRYHGMGKIKGFLIYVLCDETFSIVSSVNIEEGINKKKFYFFVSLLDYLYWIIGSCIGALLGHLLRLNFEGLDFVLTALFVVILLEQLYEKKNRIPAVIGILCTIVCLLLFGQEYFILPSMLLILVTLLTLKRPLEHKKKEEL